MNNQVKCPYCNNPAELVDGTVIYLHRPDLAHKKFWNCAPCKAYVGCHETTFNHDFPKGTMPLGRLANAELRSAKSAAHALFDPLWKTGKMRRGQAYAWLADQLKIKQEDCHIGMFSVEQCKQVFQIMRCANSNK